MSENSSSELTIRTHDGTEGTIHNLSAPVMQAIYHQITGKREVISQRYNGDYIITKDSIRQFVERLYQTIEQYHPTAQNCEVTILHHHKDKVTCSSVERFIQYDEERTDHVSSVFVNASFLIPSPIQGEFHSYTVSIEIKSYLLLKNDKFARYAMYGGRREIGIKLQIEYVDYVISRSLISMTEEWIESLEKENVFRLPTFISEAYLLTKIVSAIISFCILYGLSSNGIRISTDYVTNTVSFIMVFFILSYFLEMINDKLEMMIGFIGDLCVIKLNKGDSRNIAKFHKTRRRYNSIFTFIFFSLFLASLVSVFSSYIFEFYFR